MTLTFGWLLQLHGHAGCVRQYIESVHILSLHVTARLIEYDQKHASTCRMPDYCQATWRLLLWSPWKNQCGTDTLYINIVTYTIIAYTSFIFHYLLVQQPLPHTLDLATSRTSYLFRFCHITLSKNVAQHLSLPTLAFLMNFPTPDGREERLVPHILHCTSTT